MRLNIKIGDNMKQIIMSAPDNFKVDYVINPHMIDNEDKVNFIKAMRQWNDLRNVLVQAGVDVIVTPLFPEDCPDSVFTANAGLIYKNIFVASRFKHPQRQVEEEHFEAWFKDHFFDMHKQEKLSFEGAGDALFSKDRINLWMGYGFRTSGDFKFELDKIFEQTDVIVRPLGLVDPRFYHLDTCFCPLDTGELIWYPPAFDQHSQDVINLWYKNKMIVVSEEDALKFACNAISVNDNIIFPRISTNLLNELNVRGYNPIEVDMSEFLLSGGACKCLTLEVI